jgi:PAS domain-containing protein
MNKSKEEILLYSAAVRSSRVILEARKRKRAEHELDQIKKTLAETKAERDRSLSLLRATIESTADGLLVTDENGELLCYNQLYLDMWPIPRELMKTVRHQALIRHCCRYLKDPEQFVLSTDEIYKTWPQESFDVLQFHNDRLFERYTKLQFVEGRKVGRVWSSRDITERRQADAYKAQLAAIV